MGACSGLMAFNRSSVFRLRRHVDRGKAGAARVSISVPSSCTIDGFATEISRVQGVSVADLQPFTSLKVQTRNTIYEITVPTPSEPTVFVRGGRVFPILTEAGFNGSSFGGSCLKVAWFCVGLHLEFRCVYGTILTSKVRSIEFLEASSLPGPF